MKKFLSWLFIIQSLSLLTVGLYEVYLNQNPAPLAFTKYTYEQQDTNDVLKNAPIRITISSLGINLPVYQSHIVNNVWQTTYYGASYLTSSPIPGNTGNSIIYAHDFRNLFGNLVNAKVGEKVVITYPDHTKKTFVIEYTSVVSPDESSILAPSKDKRITMYTCTGFLDSRRFVAVAVLQT
jgi:LPXTG-site transpeptidase (sortase) family protein